MHKNHIGKNMQKILKFKYIGKKTFYIYKFTFPNNKIYIGCTTDIKKRFYGTYNEDVINAFQEFGFENVKKEILEIIKTDRGDRTAFIKESNYIKKYKSYLPFIGYNIRIY